MKLRELLKEDDYDNMPFINEYEWILKDIARDCKQFIRTGVPLYRGVRSGRDEVDTEKIRQDRKYLTSGFSDMGIAAWNLYIQSETGVPNVRAASKYTTTNREIAKRYAKMAGKVYYVFPKDDAKYVWNTFDEMDSIALISAMDNYANSSEGLEDEQVLAAVNKYGEPHIKTETSPNFLRKFTPNAKVEVGIFGTEEVYIVDASFDFHWLIKYLRTL